MPATLDQFRERILQSGLLSAAEVQGVIEALRSGHKPADGEQLARELVRSKRATNRPPITTRLACAWC